MCWRCATGLDAAPAGVEGACGGSSVGSDPKMGLGESHVAGLSASELADVLTPFAVRPLARRLTKQPGDIDSVILYC